MSPIIKQVVSAKVKKKPATSKLSTVNKKKLLEKEKADRIKDKLSGKNYSPIVAKAQKKVKKKKEQSGSTPSKKENTTVVKANSIKGPKPLDTTVEEKKNIVKNANTPVKRKLKDPVVEVSTKKNKVALSAPVENSKNNNKKGAKSILSRKVEVVSNDGVMKSSLKEPKKQADKKQKQPTLHELVSLNSKQIEKEGVVEASKADKSVGKGKKISRTEKGKVSKVKPKPISNVKSLKKHTPLSLKKKSLKRRSTEQVTDRGVCYFSHIPHGFYADELKKYCSQFGKVTGVYHPVSKNGNSRGYAFVEFLHKDVAQVVAETMNNYLMFNRLVKCELVPPDRCRPWVFKHKKPTSQIAAARREKAMKARARTLSKEEEEKLHKRRMRRVQTLHKKLAGLGVDYEFQVNDGSEEQDNSPEN